MPIIVLAVQECDATGVPCLHLRRSHLSQTMRCFVCFLYLALRRGSFPDAFFGGRDFEGVGRFDLAF